MAEPQNIAPSPGLAIPHGEHPKSDRGQWVRTARVLLKVALVMLVLRTFVFSPFSIPSESMQPRLLIGDFLIVSKWNYGYSRYSFPFGEMPIEGRIFGSLPKRGDVVVFKAPPSDREDYIKRVIGLPGDTVRVEDGQVILNGVPVERKRVDDLVIPVTANMLAAAKQNQSPSPCFREHFETRGADGHINCRYPQYRETLPGGKSYKTLDLVRGLDVDNTESFTVPDGHLFLMGDNRDRSADSRLPAIDGMSIGMVPVENVVGRAQITIFSTDGSASWTDPLGWFSATRWSRIGEGF